MTDLVRTGEPTELERIQAAGVEALAKREELNRLYKQIQGTSWGDAAKKQLTPAGVAAMAAFCFRTGAEPQTHIDILGKRPYLNTEYWRELVATHPRYIDSEQENISDDAVLRKQWGAPEEVEAVWVTRIRYLPVIAPLGAIAAGRLTPDEVQKWVKEAVECNWAGGLKNDPVGNQHPHKTARTRSFRRAAKLAFAAWMVEHQRELDKAVEVLDAEWETVVKEDGESYVPGQLRVGAGEARPVPQAAPEPEPEPEERPDLLEDGKKRYFATLRELKLLDQRKDWQKRNGLPESVKDFRLADFERAVSVLLKPLRTAVLELCEKTGTDLEQLSDMLLSKPAPDYAKDWTAVHNVLKRKAAALEEKAEPEKPAGEAEQGDLQW